MTTATMERTDSTSTTNVGNLFKFSYPERALITVMLDEYDSMAKAAWKQMAQLNLSYLQIDGARSRVAVVKDLLDGSKEDDTVTLTEPLRSVLGDACSLHARKLAKLKDSLPKLLVDSSDVEDALERTTHIANRIGEQLTLFVESPDDE